MHEAVFVNLFTRRGGLGLFKVKKINGCKGRDNEEVEKFHISPLFQTFSSGPDFNYLTWLYGTDLYIYIYKYKYNGITTTTRHTIENVDFIFRRELHVTPINI